MMNGNAPSSSSSTSSRRPFASASTSRTTASATRPKRDSLMAELERDPQHATAKRQQRSQAFSSHMAHASLERKLLSAQSAQVELENKLRQKEAYIEQLEGDRRFLTEREQAEREEKEKEREVHAEDKRTAEGDLRTLRDAIATLRNDHIELEEAFSELSRTHDQHLATHEAESSVLTRRNGQLEQELVEYRAVAEERDATIQVLQQKLDAGVATSSSDPVQQDENWAVIRDELHRQASYLRSLETTNAKLNAELGRYKDRHANLEVLREEKRALERKVLIVDELREKVVCLEAQVEAARRERQEWANKSNEEVGRPSLSVVESLSEIRLAHARLLEEHGANTAVLKSREAELARTSESLSEAQGTSETLRNEVQALKDKVSRREQRARLAEREVGFLQALVASFTAEDQASREGSTMSDSGYLQRVQQLEQSLSEYKATNDQLQKALDAIDGEGGTRLSRSELRQQMEYHKRAAEEAAKALEEARGTVKVNEDRVEELEQTLFELRGTIGAGNHVPPGMRVLCLRDNPAQQWNDLRQSVMDRLKNENEALIKRLRDLETSGVSSSPGEELVPRESWEVLEKEKEELEDKVKQREKRLQRLQEVFQAKSAEFREAIASILGVKLAFYPNGQVRVTSVYDLSASFVFQPLNRSGNGDGARMQLIAQGEGGPQDLPQLMRYWVDEEECIPGFLASVTLECYDKSKREAT